MTDLREAAESIAEQFADHVAVDADDVEARLETLVDEYRIPLDEARRSVTNYYLDEAGIDREDLSRSGGNQEVQVADIDRPEQWIDVEVTVVDLWDPRSDAVAQVGLVGDPSGTLKFTK